MRKAFWSLISRTLYCWWGRNNFLSTNRYSSIMSPTYSTVYILHLFHCESACAQFILLINCPFDDVISESQRKGTAVLGDGEIIAGLLPEVVTTGAGVCDNVPERGQNRVATHLF